MIALFLAAIIKGDAPERLSATVLVTLFLSFDIYRSILGADTGLSSPDLGFFIFDLLAAAVLIVIAVRANRLYTLWLAGFQIIALLAHLARALTDAISPIAYAIMYIGPSYFQIIILGFGIWLHHKRVKRHGTYRAWRSSSNLSQDRQLLP